MIIPEPKVIELRMREIAQLFNSLDPSPFMERDLDANAEEFIVSWSAEIPMHYELQLVIHLATAPALTVDVREAVRSYFQHRAEHKQRELSQLLWRGRLSLLVGCCFWRPVWVERSWCNCYPWGPWREWCARGYSLWVGSRCGGLWRFIYTIGGRCGRSGGICSGLHGWK